MVAATGPGLLWIVVAYLIGSIPFGLILTKLFTKQDIRNIGSGNIGATNVLRTGNKTLAVYTLLLDMLKGAVLIIALKLYYVDLSGAHSFTFIYVLIGLGAIIGHCFPVCLKFKGGKGVATTFGVLFAAVPWAGFIAVVTWGIVAGFTRYSSLSAICSVAIAPLVTFIYYGPIPATITVLIAALVIWRHKENIKRLTAGTEPKIFQPKENDEPSPTKH